MFDQTSTISTIVFTTSKTHFLANNKIYHKTDEVGMGSPLGLNDYMVKHYNLCQVLPFFFVKGLVTNCDNNSKLLFCSQCNGFATVT